MKKHPLLFNFIFTMAIQIGVYLIEIFEVQIIEPMLQAMGVRSEGILPPTAVVSLIVFSAVLIAAAIAAGVIRSKVYFWIPSFLLIFVGFAIYYPDNLARIKEDNIINLPWIAEHFGYGSIMSGYNRTNNYGDAGNRSYNNDLPGLFSGIHLQLKNRGAPHWYAP